MSSADEEDDDEMMAAGFGDAALDGWDDDDGTMIGGTIRRTGEWDEPLGDGGNGGSEDEAIGIEAA